nr:hypothetical protein [Tanacetum cinerariifolium]
MDGLCLMIRDSSSSRIGRTVPLLPVALDRAESELEASVDKLFDEGGSGNQMEQGGSAGSGRGADVQLVSKATDTVAKDVAPLQPRRQRKRKTVVVGAGEASYPPKKLWDDHGTSSRPSVAGSSRHSGANVAEAEVDSLVRSSVPVMTGVTTVTSTVDPALVVKKTLERHQWVRLNDGRVCHEMVDEFAPPKFFASVRAMEHDQPFIEFNVGDARQMSLSAEDEVLKVREREIEDLKAQMLLKEAKVAEFIRLRAEASNFEIVEKSLRDEANALKERNTILEKDWNALDMKVTGLEASVVHEPELSSFGLQEKVAVYEDCMGQLDKFQDDRVKEVNDKFDELYADFIEMDLHLEERALTDVATYNPSAEADYISALQHLQSVNFSLLAELRSNKDASVDTLMNILRLKKTLAERLGLTESQPHVDQLMVPIHHSPDKVFVGTTALSLALDVSNIQTTVGRTVPLLSVALDRAESELEANVDKLFDEGGSGNQMEQGGSAGSGRGADVQLVSKATDTVAKDVAPLQPRRQRKRKTVVVGAGEASHPPKKLRDDHGTSIRPSVAAKSKHVVQRLVARAVLNVDVRGEAIPSLPFVTTLVSAIPEREGGDHTDFVGSLLLPQRLIMLWLLKKPVKPSLFSADSSSAGGANPNTVERHQWVRLNDGRVCHEMVDEFAPPKFFASVRAMEHDQPFTEFNVGDARQMSLSAEDEVLKVREREIEDLKAQMLLKEAKVAEVIRLRAEASNFEIVEKSLRDEANALKERNTILEKDWNALDMKVTGLEASVVHEPELSSFGLQEKVAVYEDCMGQLDKFQDDRVKEVNDKFDELYADFIKMDLHLEERALTDVATYNPSAEADYISALQHLQSAGGTSDIVPTATVTTTDMSTTLASASTVAPISIDDYEVVGTDDQAGANGNANPFPNVDDAELNVS